MNFTMVIADDEPVVLKSEELFIKKEFPEIDIVGMAENGIELKQMLERLKPDMAMVDIHMPGLSGIEVIELLQHKNCSTRFIINTAYSDFDYVKKALDLKTDGYLLKPAKREERIATIRRLCQAIEEEKKESVRQNSLKSAMGVVNLVLGSEILMSVFSEKHDEEGFQAYCNINNIKFTGGCIVTFLSKTKTEISHKLLNAELEDALSGLCSFLSTITSQGIVVMFFVPEELEEERWQEWCGELAALVEKRLEEALGIEYLYGVGNVYTSFSSMQNSYQDSVDALQVLHRKDAALPEESADKIQQYIQKTKQYIETNYRKDISLMDCARSVGISPYYLSHIFKERTGQTFVEYLSQVRIEEAKRLCRNTNLTINEISEKCGYFNITYFCKVFKRLTGKTIGEYRKS